jgi:hypothetical protein
MLRAMQDGRPPRRSRENSAEGGLITAWTGLRPSRACPAHRPFHHALRLGVARVWLYDRPQTADSRRDKPGHFDLAVGPPMCRTRAEEHVTSMNSAISTSQKTSENYLIVSQCITLSVNAITKNVQECPLVLCRIRCRRASNEQPWGGWHPLTVSNLQPLANWRPTWPPPVGGLDQAVDRAHRLEVGIRGTRTSLAADCRSARSR